MWAFFSYEPEGREFGTSETPSLPFNCCQPLTWAVSLGIDCLVLCRSLCRNPAIPTGVGVCRRVSLGNSCEAVNSDQSRMNTAPACRCNSLAVTRSSFGLRIRDQGVGGSNPLSPTNLFNKFQPFWVFARFCWCRFCDCESLTNPQPVVHQN